jgi:hypothetical protein
MIASEKPRCPRCDRILHSTLSRGYHNSNQPLVGFCGMCARELNIDSQTKGEDESNG